MECQSVQPPNDLVMESLEEVPFFCSIADPSIATGSTHLSISGVPLTSFSPKTGPTVTTIEAWTPSSSKSKHEVVKVDASNPLCEEAGRKSLSSFASAQLLVRGLLPGNAEEQERCVIQVGSESIAVFIAPRPRERGKQKERRPSLDFSFLSGSMDAVRTCTLALTELRSIALSSWTKEGETFVSCTFYCRRCTMIEGPQQFVKFVVDASPEVADELKLLVQAVREGHRLLRREIVTSIGAAQQSGPKDIPPPNADISTQCFNSGSEDILSPLQLKGEEFLS